MNKLTNKAIQLLKDLIKIESYSFNENETGNRIEKWLESYGIEIKRNQNNVYAYNKFYDSNKPTILLNSHHDTVKPNKGYKNDPFNSVLLNERVASLQKKLELLNKLKKFPNQLIILSLFLKSATPLD